MKGYDCICVTMVIIFGFDQSFSCKYATCTHRFNTLSYGMCGVLKIDILFSS